ncbi:cytochrome c-type biogenesis protein CcmH [Rhodobium orientis]|uniref:Cytochrome c-type biogenesis protein n=1 Tax=Rhodobium orientis TaxID=34017 RepID=A0A327JFG1_9HYPH|nr:cytochrome c-type biogenesis protein [Rhodobium orientis]MBB4305055.1 cytochrome c-type biogenesis protein CcmH [Rhodobium orientis]MBK5949893.1 cytochrome c-type biogenesis protein CcmH [Rhodobium orientis]RAI24855.1 cytochrome c-type biogenesis protein CcmH [Rhodobium orientis]
MKRIAALFLTVFWLALPAAVHAVEPDEMLKDPKLEHRAREISEGLRCLVCQNQSIDDSNAELAKDLRVLVRDRLKAGDSNEEVIDYLVNRYGEFVLLKPRFGGHTLILWLTAPAVLVLGIVAVFFAWRRQRSAAAAGPRGPVELTDAERAELEKVLKDRKGG